MRSLYSPDFIIRRHIRHQTLVFYINKHITMLPTPIDQDSSMLSRKFGREVANYFSGSFLFDALAMLTIQARL